MKFINEKEIKIDDENEDISINKPNTLNSTTNKNLQQRLKKSTDLFTLNSTPKTSHKFSLNEKNRNNASITNFNTNIINSQNHGIDFFHFNCFFNYKIRLQKTPNFQEKICRIISIAFLVR